MGGRLQHRLTGSSESWNPLLPSPPPASGVTTPDAATPEVAAAFIRARQPRGGASNDGAAPSATRCGAVVVPRRPPTRSRRWDPTLDLMLPPRSPFVDSPAHRRRGDVGLMPAACGFRVVGPPNQDEATSHRNRTPTGIILDVALLHCRQPWRAHARRQVRVQFRIVGSSSPDAASRRDEGWTPSPSS